MSRLMLRPQQSSEVHLAGRLCGGQTGCQETHGVAAQVVHGAPQPGHGPHHAAQVGLAGVEVKVGDSVLRVLVIVILLLVVHYHLQLGIVLIIPAEATRKLSLKLKRNNSHSLSMAYLP